jgi:TRAP-type uncharacterized transport system fused permease subunit
MLLIDTSAWQVALVVVTSLVGIFGVAAALNGFLFRRMKPLPRIVIAAGGLLMMDPAPLTDLVGVVLLDAVALWQYIGARKVSSVA